MNTSVQYDNAELDRLRLLEQKRNLIDEVRETVEKNLFRTYRNTLAIIVATLGTVGVAVGWPVLRSEIDDEVARQIALRTEKPIKEAEQLATNASRTMFQTLERVSYDRENINKEMSKLVDGIDYLNKQSVDASTSLKSAQAGLGELQSNTEEARKLIDFLKTTVQVKPVSQEDLNEIENRLSELAAQTSALGDAVKLVSTPGENQNRIATIKASLSTIVETKSEAPGATDKEAAIVYVQFAGGERDTIQRLTSELKARKWQIPGEERIASAAGKHEVRFYYAEDAQVAEKFAVEANALADEIGISIAPITAKKVNFAKKPNRGIIELWLQIP